MKKIVFVVLVAACGASFGFGNDSTRTPLDTEYSKCINRCSNATKEKIDQGLDYTVEEQMECFDKCDEL